MDLTDLGEAYAADHDEFLSESYRAQLHYAARSFSRFLGANARAVHLTRDLINAYLLWLHDEGRAQATLKSRRGVLLVLARYAKQTGALSEIPAIKRIRLGRPIPEAWTADEIRRLVQQCAELRGRFQQTDIPRCHFMAGLFIGLYDTGLRLSDALALGHHEIGPDGAVKCRQAKSGREIIRRFSSAALAAIDASGAAGRHLIWPLWGRKEAFFALVRRLVRDAGIRRGTTKWLRRAGITAVVRDRGLDAGREFADHRSSQTTRDHYLDARQLGDLPQPPPLF